MSEPEITTIDFNEAFPTLPRDDQEFGISFGTTGGGCIWEFVVAEVHGHDGNLIGVQARIFDDAWRAYTTIPEFFAGLAALDERPEKVSLDDVKTLCQSLGYRDETSKYAARHEHQYRCACGARLTPAPTTGEA